MYGYTSSITWVIGSEQLVINSVVVVNQLCIVVCQISDDLFAVARAHGIAPHRPANGTLLIGCACCRKSKVVFIIPHFPEASVPLEKMLWRVGGSFGRTWEVVAM